MPKIEERSRNLFLFHDRRCS